MVVAETCEISTNIPRRFISRTTRYTHTDNILKLDEVVATPFQSHLDLHGEVGLE